MAVWLVASGNKDKSGGSSLRKLKGILLSVLLSGAVFFTGCQGNGGGEAAVMSQDEISVISHTFNHNSFADSIFMILPKDWTYDTYEKINAGEKMDSYEWGYDLYIDGDSGNEISIYGTKGVEEMPQDEGMDFSTANGLQGKRYVKEIEEDDGSVVREEYLVLHIPDNDFAVYVVSYSISNELYQEKKEILENFLINIGVSSVAVE